MRGFALLVGQLTGVAVAALAQAIVYVLVGLAIGVDFRSGATGILLLLVLAVVIALAFGAIGALMALRTGSGESVQGLFPLLFVFLLLSSMNLPRNLIEIGWFRDAATANPVSYLIEGIRSLVIEGWNAQALLLAFAVATAIGFAALAAATRALRMRMART
jgi:ABC-2 type transport system permease protein